MFLLVIDHCSLGNSFAAAIKEDEDEDRGLWGIKIDLPLPWFGKNKKKE